MSLKSFISATYGSSIYLKTTRLQATLCKAATAKNQLIFLNRCIHHKVIPKFLQLKCPLNTRRTKIVNDKYKRELLISTKNDTKERYFGYYNHAKQLEESLREELSIEHYEIISNVTESSREKTFVATRSKLKHKFELLYSSKYKINNITNENEHSRLQELCNENEHSRLVKDCFKFSR